MNAERQMKTPLLVHGNRWPILNFHFTNRALFSALKDLVLQQEW
jgi:hypothetical protein